MGNSRRKVLVVEDDDSMRAALDRLLGAAGFETKVYASAEALLADGPDTQAVCAVADLKLPGCRASICLPACGPAAKVSHWSSSLRMTFSGNENRRYGAARRRTW